MSQGRWGAVPPSGSSRQCGVWGRAPDVDARGDFRSRRTACGGSAGQGVQPPPRAYNRANTAVRPAGEPRWNRRQLVERRRSDSRAQGRRCTVGGLGPAPPRQRRGEVGQVRRSADRQPNRVQRAGLSHFPAPLAWGRRRSCGQTAAYSRCQRAARRPAGISER